MLTLMLFHKFPDEGQLLRGKSAVWDAIGHDGDDIMML
jgi:hypothetical protein